MIASPRASTPSAIPGRRTGWHEQMVQNSGALQGRADPHPNAQLVLRDPPHDANAAHQVTLDFEQEATEGNGEQVLCFLRLFGRMLPSWLQGCATVKRVSQENGSLWRWKCEYGLEILITLAYLVYWTGVSIDKACGILGFFPGDSPQLPKPRVLFEVPGHKRQREPRDHFSLASVASCSFPGSTTCRRLNDAQTLW